MPEQRTMYQLSVLARRLACQPTEADTVARTVELAAELLPCAAVDVVRRGRSGSVRVVATTDSVRSGATRHIEELSDPADVATDIALIRRSLSWPSLPPGTDMIGAERQPDHPGAIQGSGYVLRFHPVESRPWTERDLQVATAFADIAAVAIDRAAFREQAHTLAAGLESNRVIGTAIGIIMSGRCATYDDGFGLLRDWSQRTNCKLRQIADEVILTGDIPGRADAGAA